MLLSPSEYDDTPTTLKSKKQTFTAFSPSRAVLEVQRLEQQRIERRREQLEQKRIKDSLDGDEQKIHHFKSVIQKFRVEFGTKRVVLKAKLAKEGAAKKNGLSVDTVNQAGAVASPKIQVCVRKRPLNPKGKQSREKDWNETSFGPMS